MPKSITPEILFSCLDKSYLLIQSNIKMFSGKQTEGISQTEYSKSGVRTFFVKFSRVRMFISCITDKLTYEFVMHSWWRQTARACKMRETGSLPLDACSRGVCACGLLFSTPGSIMLMISNSDEGFKHPDIFWEVNMICCQQSRTLLECTEDLVHILHRPARGKMLLDLVFSSSDWAPMAVQLLGQSSWRRCCS